MFLDAPGPVSGYPTRFPDGEAFAPQLPRDVEILSALDQQRRKTVIPVVCRSKYMKMDAAAFVADDNPNLWRWVIFPPGFHAPALMDLAKRQAWALKPAILAQPDRR